ncbi:MAG: hypothetical protein AAGK78_15410, partial [Planctomycetota bacterium]
MTLEAEDPRVHPALTPLSAIDCDFAPGPTADITRALPQQKRGISMTKYAAVALAIAAAMGTAHAQRDFQEIEIKTTKVVDGVYMLEGAGGNIGLSTGADGAF